MIYTVDEAVDTLKERGIVITNPMIRYYLRTGTIKGKWTGKTWVITQAELTKFAKNRRQ